MQKRHLIEYALVLIILLMTHVAVAGSLVDNGNGTISDQGTHLMWQKQDDGATRTWAAAITYCQGLTLASYTDWRLPTIKELKSIADLTTYSPAINTTYFPGTRLSYYWSSTTNVFNTTYAWYVDFANGGSDNYDKTNNFLYYARCVR